ncbi:MAG TPA: hypothetical protein VE462_13910 [Propionibacteriaceae bacterium]|nr:hypothetical protein [Propionibacteriaceae bacterium]
MTGSVSRGVRRSVEDVDRRKDTQKFLTGTTAQFRVALSNSGGLPINDISHLVGQANTLVTELIYRNRLRHVRPRLQGKVDTIFDGPACQTWLPRSV